MSMTRSGGTTNSKPKLTFFGLDISGSPKASGATGVFLALGGRRAPSGLAGHHRIRLGGQVASQALYPFG